jgi:hypothetical protein
MTRSNTHIRAAMLQIRVVQVETFPHATSSCLLKLLVCVCVYLCAGKNSHARSLRAERLHLRHVCFELVICPRRATFMTRAGLCRRISHRLAARQCAMMLRATTRRRLCSVCVASVTCSARALRGTPLRRLSFAAPSHHHVLGEAWAVFPATDLSVGACPCPCVHVHVHVNQASSSS